jgi:hypothetical protein
MEEAFTAYCKQYVREYYQFYNGQTTTAMLLSMNAADLERMWGDFLTELKSQS